MSLTPVDLDPLDECVCGDYRRDHVDSSGPCKMNGLGHGVPGYRCERFTPAGRLALENTEK